MKCQQITLGLRRPRTTRQICTGYPYRGANQCGHEVATEICDGDAKRVLCDQCGVWLVEFGTHRDGRLK